MKGTPKDPGKTKKTQKQSEKGVMIEMLQQVRKSTDNRGMDGT